MLAPKVVIPESAQRLSGTQVNRTAFAPSPWVPDSPCGASGMTTHGGVAGVAAIS